MCSRLLCRTVYPNYHEQVVDRCQIAGSAMGTITVLAFRVSLAAFAIGLAARHLAKVPIHMWMLCAFSPWSKVATFVNNVHNCMCHKH